MRLASRSSNFTVCRLPTSAPLVTRACLRSQASRGLCGGNRFWVGPKRTAAPAAPTGQSAHHRSHTSSPFARRSRPELAPPNPPLTGRRHLRQSCVFTMWQDSRSARTLPYSPHPLQASRVLGTLSPVAVAFHYAARPCPGCLALRGRLAPLGFAFVPESPGGPIRSFLVCTFAEAIDAAGVPCCVVARLMSFSSSSPKCLVGSFSAATRVLRVTSSTSYDTVPTRVWSLLCWVKVPLAQTKPIT